MFNHRNKNKSIKTLLLSIILLLVSGLFLLTQVALAQIDKALDISAYILDKNNEAVSDGTYSVRFAIYTSKTGGSSEWSETQDVEVKGGLFDTQLGQDKNLPEDIDFSEKEYYIGIKIENDSESKPRKPIGYVPLALNSDKLQGYIVGTGEDNIPILNEDGEISSDLLPIGSKEDKLIVLNEDGEIDEEFIPTGTGDSDYVQGDDDRLHDQNTDTGTKSLTFNLGRNKAVSNNFDLTVSNSSAKPALRYNGASSTWQYSNDGITYSDIGSATGNYLDTTGGTMTGNITFNSTQTFGGSSLTELGYLNALTLVPGSVPYASSSTALASLDGVAGDDAQYLRFNWNAGVPTLSWETVSSGGTFNDFTLSGDSGTDQAIEDGNTLEIAGGANISTVASATDTITINLGSTISGTTWNGSIIGVAYGGTGLASYTTGDLIYASGTTTLSKLAGVATGNSLISGGVGVAPSWGKIGLTTHVSGTLPAANGGTGIDTSSSTGVPTISSGTWSVSATLPDSLVANNLTIASGTIGTSAITLVNSATPTPTTEAVIEWDSDDNRLVIGDGSGQTTFYSGQGAGGSFTLAGDSGSETVQNGNTLTIAGGTNLTSAVSATDTATINLDSTISGVTWNGTAIGATYGGTGIDTSSSTGVPTISSGTWSVSSTLGVATGGTGLASYTVGDLIYASGTTTLSKLAGVATGNSLISGGVGVAPGWGKIGLTTHVSGTLPAANGGTGIDTSSSTGVPTISSGTWSVSATLPDSLVANNLTIASGTIGTSAITLVNSATPTPTTEAVIEWDSDDNRLVIGDGSGQTTFYSGQGAGGSFTLAGDSGSETVQNGNTLTIAGGTNLTSAVSATDTATINLDSTISGVTWNGTAIGATYGGTGIDTSSSTGVPTISSGTWSVSATLGVATGGTGLASYTVGDLIYASGTTTLSKLAGVATGNSLISGGVGVSPSWGKIGLSTHVSGTLPAANGGTGTATQFTTGSLVFAGASGVYSQDNSNLFWDDTSDYLGIGNATPEVALHIGSTSSTLAAASDSVMVSGDLEVAGSAYLGAMEFAANSGAVSWVDMPVTSSASIGTVESYSAMIDGSSILTVYAESDGAGGIRNNGIGLGTISPETMLDVAGTTRTTAATTTVLTGTIDPVASTTVTGVGTIFTDELIVGDRITVTGQTRTVMAIASDTSLTVGAAFSDNANDTSPDKLPAQFIVRDSSDNVDFVISERGYAGIGITNPNEKLVIDSGSVLLDNAQGYKINDSTGIARALVSYTTLNNAQFSNRASTGNVQILNSNDSGEIAFYTGSGSTERARFIADGSFGIGAAATAPTHLIELDSDTYGTTSGWTDVSDRNKKENFTKLSDVTVNPVGLGTWNGNGSTIDAIEYADGSDVNLDTSEFFNRMSILPIMQWNFINEGDYNKMSDEEIRHIGPTAQDFYKLFGLGASDTNVKATDMAGVALFGVKGLLEKTGENKTVIGDVSLKTDQNASTLTELQTSIDEQLALVGLSINDIKLSDDQQNTDLLTVSDQLATQNMTIIEIETRITENLNLIQTQISNQLALETQLQGQIQEIEELKTQDEAILDFMLAINTDNFITKDGDGNVTLEGNLKAEIVEGKGFVITIDDDEAPTIGRATICSVIPVDEDEDDLDDCSGNAIPKDADEDGNDDLTSESMPVDEDGNWIDDNTEEGIVNDGKTIFIETKAISDDSRIFVTPRSATSLTLFSDNVKIEEGFDIGVTEITADNIEFDWWIVESTGGN
ncbi:hypothetical protein ACFL08_01715 [Patescibacteria group bacterium]